MTEKDNSEKIQPIFVVGMNGSGTGAFVRSLSQHSNLYSFPGETKIIPHYIQNLVRFGALEEDTNYKNLWDAVRTDHVFRSWRGGYDAPLPDDWRTRPRTLAAVFDGVFGSFAAKEGKYRWCEKTPMHALHIPALHAHFPGAKFVHIIRDGRDAAASFHRRWHYTPQLTIYRWKNVVRTARSDGNSLPGGCYFELQYESLTREPEYWLKKVCEFIDEPFQEAMLTPKWPNMSVKLASGFVPNSGNWRAYFDAEKILRLERISGKLLAEYGYEVEFETGDEDPPAIRQWYWANLDRARSVRDIIMNAFNRPNSGVVGMFNSIRSALSKGYRQKRSMK